jgi:hypothetical protein
MSSTTNTPEAQASDPFPQIRWGDRIRDGKLDCETAVLLRAHLLPVFDAAQTWRALADGLAARGFRLAFRDAKLALTELETGLRICNARFLGVTLEDLAARLGRPTVVALRGGAASGEFLH